MAVERVKLTPLHSIQFENLTELEPHEIAKKLEGSDLVLNTETKRLESQVDGRVQSKSFLEEAAWVRLLRGADGNKDEYLDLQEARDLIQQSFPAAEVSQIDPQGFLDAVAKLVERRYAPIAGNFQEWRAELAFKPTLDALEAYNHGIRIEEIRQADSVFNLRALHKTAGNILLFIPNNLIRRPFFGLTGQSKADESALILDDVAKASAKERYEARAEAIAALREVISAGQERGEVWALEGNLSAALSELEKTDETKATKLKVQLIALEIDRIVRLEDPKERYEALLSFAQAERPSFLGYGGGNSEDAHVWNYTGGRNNLYFARSLLGFLESKAISEDAGFDDALRTSSVEIQNEMLGDGGGFGNLASVGLTNLLCLGGLSCEPTPYREWGDEAEMDAVGRSLDIGLTVYSSHKGLQAFKEMWQLRRHTGIRGVARVWWENKKIIPPLPTKAWHAARLNIERDLADASRTAGKDLSRQGWVIQGVGWLKDKLFGKLPPLDPAMQRALHSAHQTGGKFMRRLTDGVIILLITQYADAKNAAYFNPFEKAKELDVDPWPDPTAPDPALTPIP